MTTKHNTVAPEALGQRPDLDHNRYESGGTPLDFDGVSVSFGTPLSHTLIKPLRATV